MEKARRRHVPAFGEWNYYYHYDEPELPPTAVAADWYAAEPEACSDVWFKYSPPPLRTAPKKVRRPECGIAPEKALRRGGKGRLHSGRATAPDAGGVLRTPAMGACRVVRPVDEDLYQVPAPEDFVSHRPRWKRAGRSLWMGCLGFNCVA